MEYVLKTPILPIEENYSVIEKVFAARGIPPSKLNDYINPTADKVLEPTLLDNVKDGAKMLLSHISDNDEILVIVDSDADGFTSAAVFINYLYGFSPWFTQNKVSYRLHEGKQHGLEDMVDYILEHKEFKLIVCPDSSSNDYDYHKTLKKDGRDILILDHHEAPRVSEYACVINNQLSDYPNKTLSGAGVVYKFCSYIDNVMNYHISDNLLDLVAFGMIGDMMDLRNEETKYFINKGLDNITNPFATSIVEKQSFSINKAGGLCPFAVTFYIVPMINATIRSGTIEEKILLFESMLEFKGNTLIPSTKRGCKGQMETVSEQVCRNVVNTKRHQDNDVTKSMEVVEQIINNNDLTRNKIIAIKTRPEWGLNRNFTGLIANKLMGKYQHPVLILTRVEHPDGTISWDGSGRGYETPKLPDFRNYLESTPFINYAQGHANAFGVSIKDETFTEFIKSTNEELKECNFVSCYKVDFEWLYGEVKAKDIFDIAKYKTLWGEKLEEPYIVIKDIPITKSNIEFLGKDADTIKILLPNGVNAIKFKVSEEEKVKLAVKDDYNCVKVTLVGKCAINEWGGNVAPQILISDYEITSENEYYF